MRDASATLTGRSCLVTGATGGIGRALAHRFAELGCGLFLTARSSERLIGLAAEISDAHPGVQVLTHAADLGDFTAVQELIAVLESSYDPLSILINNAGVFPVMPLGESDLAAYDHCFGVNVRAPFILSQRFAPRMAHFGWGRIVNIGSSSSYGGFPNTAIYCASKHALLGLSRSLHAEFKGRGVRTYCISPGSVQTEMGMDVPGQDFATFIDPAEVAQYAGFLVSLDGNGVAEEIRINRMTIR